MRRLKNLILSGARLIGTQLASSASKGLPDRSAAYGVLVPTDPWLVESTLAFEIACELYRAFNRPRRKLRTTPNFLDRRTRLERFSDHSRGNGRDAAIRCNSVRLIEPAGSDVRTAQMITACPTNSGVCAGRRRAQSPTAQPRQEGERNMGFRPQVNHCPDEQPGSNSTVVRGLSAWTHGRLDPLMTR